MLYKGKVRVTQRTGICVGVHPRFQIHVSKQYPWKQDHARADAQLVFLDFFYLLDYCLKKSNSVLSLFRASAVPELRSCLETPHWKWLCCFESDPCEIWYFGCLSRGGATFLVRYLRGHQTSLARREGSLTNCACHRAAERFKHETPYTAPPTGYTTLCCNWTAHAPCELCNSRCLYPCRANNLFLKSK